MSLLPAPSDWSVLEERFHTWDIVLLNPPLPGTDIPQTRVIGQWAQIGLADSHEGVRSSVEINAEEPTIPLIHELITDFLYYRDNVLLYRLRVVDSEDVLTRDAATVKFDCVSYEKLLERRVLHEDWIIDDEDIDAAWRLIDYTQRKQTFGITRGTTIHGVRRQRGLDAGDDILTAINDFAQADGGFDWWIDENLKFQAQKPRRGKKLNIEFQMGGEVGELSRLSPIEDYASLILATGAQQETRIPRDNVFPVMHGGAGEAGASLATADDVFPTLHGGAGVEVGSSLGTHEGMPRPAGLAKGDLMIAVVTVASATAITPSTGWTELVERAGSGTHRCGVYGRLANGTSSDTFQPSGGTNPYACSIMRISGHSVDSVTGDVHVAAANGSGAVNSPALNAGSSKKWLWMSVASAGSAVSGTPAGYTLAYNPLGAAGVGLGVAWHIEETQIEDPAAWRSGSTVWESFTVAVPGGKVAATKEGMPRPKSLKTGDLMIASITCASSTPIKASSGWTEILQRAVNTTHRSALFGRIASGAAADTFDPTGVGRYACSVVRISNHSVDSVRSDIKVSAAVGAGTINPPPLHAGSTGKWLWMTVGAGTDPISGTPPGYSLAHTPVSTTGIGLGVAWLTKLAETENPSTWGSSPVWESYTLAIPEGSGGEDIYPPPHPQVAQLKAKPFGLWEYTASDTDVITPAGLMEKAKWHLADKGAVRPSYKVGLEPGVWTPGIKVGDVFTLRFDDTRTEASIKVGVRIEELGISCTADGAETVSLSVRAEKPETAVLPPAPFVGMLAAPSEMAALAAPDDSVAVLADDDDGVGPDPDPNGRTVQRNRLNATDDLGALLRSLRKRLDRIERSPGTGIPVTGTTILDGPYPPTPLDGSPGNYWVDTVDDELYGPKNTGLAVWPEPVHWTSFGPADAVRNDIQAGQLGIARRPMNIVGFRYGGTPDADTEITITFWEYWTGAVLYSTTGPGTGSDGFVSIPSLHFEPDGRWAVSLGGHAVPVGPGEPNGVIADLPEWVYLVSPGGLYTAPLSGPVGNDWTWTGYSDPVALDLELMVQLDAPYIDGDEEVGTTVPVTATPTDNIRGEVGANVYVYERGHLLGWRYRRLESSSPLTFNVWTFEWRFYDPAFANVKQFPLDLLTTVIATDVGDGEFEIRLASPILLDPLGIDGPDEVAISFGGEAVPYSVTPADRTGDGDWYNLGFTDSFAWYSATPGEFPQDTIPGSVYPNYYNTYIFPIMSREEPVWPLSNTARSGSQYEVAPERVELHRNIAQSFAGDATGLRFYEGGPSHDVRTWRPGEGVPWFSTALQYGGYSGMEFTTDDWYDESGHTVPPEPATYTNKYAFYNWYYDYASFEQDADLDVNDPYWPGSYYEYFQDHGVWDDDAYWSLSTYGPRHGATVNGEDSGATQGGAGFHCEASGLDPLTAGDSTANETTALATMMAIADDGIHGTQLTVTPRVIQASFPPAGVHNTWWYGDGSAHQGLTPKGCVVPLITAASTTATSADEPWQKQFFRQIGINTVTFTDGVGIIPVPIGMGLPAVVNAQVDGVTVGGTRVAQAQRTGDNVITVALDTALAGDLAINWSVDAAAITFGTPPPSIDTIRNPGSSYLYGPRVEYDPGGGAWPFELVSWGNTFADGCILKDFTGATVGGPFTPEDVVLTGDIHYQRVLWDAGRDWYLPGQEQQYRMTNPDGQVSAWNVITWYDDPGFAAVETVAAARMATMAEPTVADEEPTGPVARPNRYANNPRLQTQINPLAAQPVDGLAARATSAETPATPEGRGPDDPLDPGPRLGKPLGGKERWLARQERQRQERAAKQQDGEEPQPETTEQ